MNAMNRYFFSIAFGLGLLSLAWVGLGFLGTHWLALLITTLIGLVYVTGAQELRQYRQATASLTAALQSISTPLQQLDDWLGTIHASLQNPVRLRIEGERMGLPGPALTPYLVGLLVMLGMLGTFLGMVVTLSGAVFALEGTGSIQAIRAAFSEPIKGLGLAFGTSVAGVATSAMLGLMSAFCRRERAQASQQLDTCIATALRTFSLAYQRQETFKALQQQSQALPQVVEQLQTMMHAIEGMSQRLGDQLLSHQNDFHSQVKVAYTDLAAAVDQSLQDSMIHSAQVAGESIKPVIESAMRGIAHDAQQMHQQLIGTTQTQLDGMSSQFNATAAAVTQTWTSSLQQQEDTQTRLVSSLQQSLHAYTQTFEKRTQALLNDVQKAYSTLQTEHSGQDRERLEAWKTLLEHMAASLQHEWQLAGEQTLRLQQQTCDTLQQTAQNMSEQSQASATRTLAELDRLIQSSEALVKTRMAAELEWTQQHTQRMDQLAALLHAELSGLRQEEALRGQAAVDRLAELQAALAQHLTTLGTALESPITRLIETASEAPRAAAEVIGQLRQEVSNSVARDNELLEERSRILETLNTLLDSIRHASGEQRAVIDSLVTSSATALAQAGTQFADRIDAESLKLTETSAQLHSSSIEVASLSESFGFAVNAFNLANEKLIDNLQRIEKAMDQSMTRSDEQLAYYVAQAREVIDLSIRAQKDIFDELRKLPAPLAARPEEVN